MAARARGSLQPSFDLAWELVRLANRDQVVAVFVSGKMRLWRGWPADWDGRALMQQVKELAHDAVSKAPIQRIHSHSAEHRSQARFVESGHDARLERQLGGSCEKRRAGGGRGRRHPQRVGE